VVPAGLHVTDVQSAVARGNQHLSVTALGGTHGLGSIVAAASSSEPLALRTSQPTSLVLVAGGGTASTFRVPFGWTLLNKTQNASTRQITWVMYTNQPRLTPGTTVQLPRPAGSANGLTVALEIPGATT